MSLEVVIQPYGFQKEYQKLSVLNTTKSGMTEVLPIFQPRVMQI